MTEAETANVLMQVVNGLLYLKVNSILHRDMSLSNLLLTKDFKVKIADFGLATQLTRPDEKHMTLCGTPNYISPEVASRASHGLPVDVWGLGCMMYTLLVGKPPFDTNGVKLTLTRVVMSDFTLPSYLSAEAKDLLSRLLQKNPKERIHIDDVVKHPFMTKYSVPTISKYNNTIASVDSGLMTMSSDAMSTQNLTKLAAVPLMRSHSEDYQCNFTAQNYLSNDPRLLHSEENLFNIHSLSSDRSCQSDLKKQFNVPHFGPDSPNIVNRLEDVQLTDNRCNIPQMKLLSSGQFYGQHIQSPQEKNGPGDPGGGIDGIRLQENVYQFCTFNCRRYEKCLLNIVHYRNRDSIFNQFFPNLHIKKTSNQIASACARFQLKGCCQRDIKPKTPS